MTAATMTAEPVRPPSLLLALTELPRALSELGSLAPAALPLLAISPRGDGHPVMVLPGFITSDASTTVLRGFLEKLGYDALPWELGRNLGPRAIGWMGERLVERVESAHRETGKRISLIGWSLGGVMARQVSRRLPQAVRQVITLGSPFAGSPRASNVWRTYETLTGQRIDDKNTREQLKESAAPPPVPSTAIYSREDGIVAWQNCMEPASAHTDNIQVHGSHCGLGVNPAVLYAIADRLAQKDGAWEPFDRSGLRGLVYPSGGHG